MGTVEKNRHFLFAFRVLWHEIVGEKGEQAGYCIF